MKRYELRKVTQNDKEFFVLIADPKDIVKLLMNYESGEVQEAQRPWSESRVREIARYVAGKFKDDENKKSKGLIPNSPILNVKKGLEVEKDSDGYFVMLPSTKDNFKKYKNSIEAIDGQHRIRAFMEEYLDADQSASKKYEMIFAVFFNLSKNEKKEIFMITNEKQVKVPGNLLRMFKRELDLLKGDEVVYDLVCKLNEEDYSPLKNRIMIGAQKIKKGYQESQISKILNKSEAFTHLNALTKGDKEKMAKMISNYLKAWEKIYDVSYAEPGTDTITKISGLRYIFYMMPPIMDILLKREKPASTDNFIEIIEMLPNAIEVDDVFTDESTNYAFKGEGATIMLAKEHIIKLKSYDSNVKTNFNISDGI